MGLPKMATIEYSDLVFEEQLGRGAAAVFKGKWKSREMTVAIKISAQETLTCEVRFQLLTTRVSLVLLTKNGGGNRPSLLVSYYVHTEFHRGIYKQEK